MKTNREEGCDGTFRAHGLALSLRQDKGTVGDGCLPQKRKKAEETRLVVLADREPALFSQSAT